MGCFQGGTIRCLVVLVHFCLGMAVWAHLETQHLELSSCMRVSLACVHATEWVLLYQIHEQEVEVLLLQQLACLKHLQALKRHLVFALHVLPEVS